MVYCCVPLCKSEKKRSTNISFHEFPSDLIIRKHWLKAISRQGTKRGSKWIPSDRSSVCGRHFRIEDYSQSTKKKRLLPNVVPSIFENYPKYIKKNLVCRKSPKKRHIEEMIEKIDQHGNEENQANDSVIKVPQHSYSNKKYTKKIYQQKLIIRKLKTRINILESICKEKKKKESNLDKQLKKISLANDEGVLQASFLMEQIHAFGKKKIKYDEITLKICVLWQKKSPNGYEFARKMKFIHLPHKRTLKKFVGYCSGEVGVTSLIKSRLKTEINRLQHENERYGSLIIDEMAIKCKLQYDRNLDAFLGQNNTDANELGVEDRLANKLLCFLFKGLSTNYRIPVAFYFTTQLDGEQLYRLTLEVINAVEETGFYVIRVVTDNCKVNVSMFDRLSGGKASHQVQHPVHANRTLFLSFDPSHIIKNIRSQFLDRSFNVNGHTINASHLKILYKMQKDDIIKPVRFLTRKVLYPTNLEKMHVGRAKLVFSEPVTAALKTMLTVAPEKINDKAGLEETIKFLEIMRKWFDLHDVCNRSQAYTSRNMDKLIFSSLDDTRFEWLTDTFLPYIERIQTSMKEKLGAFSKETYQAICMTTLSTVECIKYLLNAGFHYILSRNFSSDDIELFFSHLRQMGGHNDMMDARSCLHGIEATLQTGIIRASVHANVEDTNSEYIQSPLRTKSLGKISTPPTLNEKSLPSSSAPDLPHTVMTILQRPAQIASTSMKMTSVAMVAGYLVRIAEENTNCPGCLERISSPSSDSPLMRLIKNQDRGGLNYPKRNFVALLGIIVDFVTEAVNYLPRRNVRKSLVIYILPRFIEELKCTICKNEKLLSLILDKFLKPLLDNYARKQTNKYDNAKRLNTKPLSRKLLKM